MPEEMFAKAKAYFQEGALEKALMVLMRYLGQNPNDPHALELRGDIAIREGYLDEAIMRLERAAEFFHMEGDYERAIVCFEKALNINPNQNEYLMRLADFYREFGIGNESIRKLVAYSERALKNDRIDGFVEGLKKICEFEPDNLELRFVFSKVLWAMNHLEEARKELSWVKTAAQQTSNRKLLDELSHFTNQPDGGEELDPKSRLELGNLLLEIGSKEEAIIEFMRASGDLVKLGQVEDAKKIFNRVLEIDPGNEQARSGLAGLSGQAAPTGPETKPRVEPKVEPKPAEPVANKYEGSDFLKDLIAEVDSFQKIEPSSEENSQEEVSQVIERSKPPEELSIEGQIADIQFLLEETAKEEKPKTKVEIGQLFEDFKRTIAWQEEDFKKRMQLAQAFFQAGMYDKAVVNLDQIKADDTTRPMLIEMKGSSLVKLGKYSEALKILPEGLVQPISEEDKLGMRYYMAVAYQGQGDYRNALMQLERILRTDENYRDARELYELLGGQPIPRVEPEAGVVEEPGLPVEEPAIVDTGEVGFTGETMTPQEEPVTRPEAAVEEPPPIIEEEPVYASEPPEVPAEYPVIEETPEKVLEFGTEKSKVKATERRSEENIVFL